MKLFAIYDAFVSDEKALAYLFYFENTQSFAIELPQTADEWETPLLLSGFAKKGIYSIGEKWAKRWVEQRIVPPDRQNLGMILKKNRLEAYDDYKLLVLADGKCAQDDCFIRPITYEALPDEIKQRLNRKVKDVLPLSEWRLLVFFRDDSVRNIDAKHEFYDEAGFFGIFNDEELFQNVRVSPGGNGIEWGSNRVIPAEKLYNVGKTLGITSSDFDLFIKHNIFDTAEAAAALNCSRQYIHQLVAAGKLHPIRSGPGGRLFYKSEIIGE